MEYICETMKDYIDAMNTSMQGDSIFCTEELWNQIMRSRPERLSPEGTIPKVDWFNFNGQKTMDCVSDSLNQANK